jgi:hypothetical protein
VFCYFDRMMISLRRAWVLPALLLVSAGTVWAHPGHDDGHELTWELGHLAAHPLATAACLVMVGAAGWAGVQLFRRATAPQPQSLRGSQVSRGK